MSKTNFYLVSIVLFLVFILTNSLATTFNVTDYDSNIQACINAMSTNDTCYIDTNTYMIESTIVLDLGKSLLGNGLTSILTNSTLAMDTLHADGNNTIDGLKFVGITGTPSTGNNITVDGNYIVVQNSYFYDGNRGVRLTSNYIHDINIINNYFENLYEHGVLLTTHSYNNYVYNNDFNGNDTSVRGVYILNSTNNFITGNRFYGQAHRGVFLNRGANNNIIIDNNFSDIAYHAISLENDTCTDANTKNNQILRNNISNSGSSGIKIEGCALYITSDNNIFDNNIYNSGVNGIEVLANATNTNISNNKISFNNQAGIKISSTNNIISQNLISNNNQNGIYLLASSNLVSNNIIQTNGSAGSYDGVRIDSLGNDNNIISNTINTITRHCIFSTDVNNILIQYNICANAWQRGIALNKNKNTKVYENTITNVSMILENGYSGITSTDGNNNTFYLNSIYATTTTPKAAIELLGAANYNSILFNYYNGANKYILTGKYILVNLGNSITGITGTYNYPLIVIGACDQNAEYGCSALTYSINSGPATGFPLSETLLGAAPASIQFLLTDNLNGEAYSPIYVFNVASVGDNIDAWAAIINAMIVYIVILFIILACVGVMISYDIEVNTPLLMVILGAILVLILLATIALL